MAPQYLSLIDPPAKGFAYWPGLRLRDLRRSVFALMAPTVEAAEVLLVPLVGKINGVILTIAPTPVWEPRAPGLYHLAVTADMVDQLTVHVAPLLSVIEREVEAREGRRACELDMQRISDDLKRLSDQWFDSSRLLSSELAERRSMEKALVDSRKWIRTVFDSVNDAILVRDVTTHEMLDVNQGMCELYGYTREEAMQKSPGDLSANTAPYDEAHAWEFMKKAAGGIPLTFEWRARHRSGRLFWVEVNLKAASINGRSCVLSVIRDISARKQAEEERLNLERQLMQARKMESLGVLAGGIAHDFNNLLMMIMGNADLALMAAKPGMPIRENILAINQATRRAADLCAQMLAYAGQAPLSFTSVDLNALLGEIRPMFETSVSNKIECRVIVSPNLPRIMADPDKLRQMIMNLVVNAAESIGDKGGVITVSTGLRRCDRNYLHAAMNGDARPEGDYVLCTVQDTGEGISRDNLLRIFDPFFTTKFTGRGLGLPAVQGIVNSHKGFIMIASEEGKGSSFTVHIPAVPACEAASVPQDAAARGGGRNGVILVVDDDEPIRLITVKMLKVMGYESITACDGREALQKLSEAKPPVACVILDLNMPGMSGEETFMEMRKRDESLPVIISSGQGERITFEKFLGHTGIQIIQKPYQLAALKAKLESVIRSDTPGA